MNNTGNNLFSYNEKAANAFIIKILWVIFMLGLVTLVVLRMTQATHLTWTSIAVMQGILGLVFITCTALGRIFAEKSFVKFIITFGSLLGLTVFIYVIGNAAYVPIILIIPLLLSSIYYNVKLTIAVGVVIPFINFMLARNMVVLSQYEDLASTNFLIASTMIVAILVITNIFITFWGGRLLGMALDLEKDVADQAADLEEILVTAKATGDQVTSSGESLAASSEQMTASLEEVAATTGQFADNARNLSDKAQVMGQAGE